jgi:hypothetical protein
MNEPLDLAWDKELNELMSTNTFILGRTRHTAYLRDTEIWIANYPYGAFRRFSDILFKGRPKRRTILKAAKKLKRETTNLQNFYSTATATATAHTELQTVEVCVKPKPKLKSRYDLLKEK